MLLFDSLVFGLCLGASLILIINRQDQENESHTSGCEDSVKGFTLMPPVVRPDILRAVRYFNLKPSAVSASTMLNGRLFQSEGQQYSTD